MVHVARGWTCQWSRIKLLLILKFFYNWILDNTLLIGVLQIPGFCFWGGGLTLPAETSAAMAQTGPMLMLM